MAEFQEVMKQWGRYCKGYTENHNDDCLYCPFETDGSCNSYAKDNAQYAAQIEEQIMSWASKHPEPVYPSWYAWLANMGIVPIELPPNQAVIVTDIGLLKKIPADIAERLGIEPKEG